MWVVKTWSKGEYWDGEGWGGSVGYEVLRNLIFIVSQGIDFNKEKMLQRDGEGSRRKSRDIEAKRQEQERR